MEKSILRFIESNTGSYMKIERPTAERAFCPGGKGAGIDPSCSSKGAGGGAGESGGGGSSPAGSGGASGGSSGGSQENKPTPPQKVRKERLRDRIEGTQKEAQKEVKKADALIQKLQKNHAEITRKLADMKSAGKQASAAYKSGMAKARAEREGKVAAAKTKFKEKMLLITARLGKFEKIAVAGQKKKKAWYERGIDQDLDQLDQLYKEAEKLFADLAVEVAGLDKVGQQMEAFLKSLPEKRRYCAGGKGAGIDPTCGGGGGSAGTAAHDKGSEAYNSREDHRAARDVADYPPANPSAPETADKHKNKDGSWTAERQAMHDEIVADATAGVPKSDNPTLYMMGGGPASGKSGLIKSGDVAHPENHVLANPDVFKEDIPEYRVGLSAQDNDIAMNSHEESSYLNKQTLKAARENEQDVVWDGTGDNSIEKLESTVKPFKEAGYKIQADYVTVDTAIAVQRSNERGAKTGRYVPEKDIRETHAKVSKIWPEAVARGLFDRSDLYDTSAGGKPVKIASARGKSLEIHDSAGYQRFLDKARDGDGDGKLNEGKN